MKHVFSPYRVCPLGAHVDHQKGLVTGFAINKGVDLWYEVTTDGSVHLESRTFDGVVDFTILTPTLVRQGDWGDYARGAKFALQKRFQLRNGIKGIIHGSLPVGGLSSSAAVLTAYVMAFADANGIVLTPMETIRIASQAEREYIGLNNGILDQACIVLGKKDHLLMLDCLTDEYRLIPISKRMRPFRLGIFFSGLTRNLVSSDYNLRVLECKVAAWDVQAFADIPLEKMENTCLRDVPREQFERYKSALPARFARRAQHFYEEYARVREGVTAWDTGDIEWFGRLSYESCESSIHNYECGSPELIALYRAMRDTEGIYGGRFSGAGFKGACVALCDPDKKDAIAESVRAKYLLQFPQYKNTFEVYFCDTANGARFMEE